MLFPPNLFLTSNATFFTLYILRNNDNTAGVIQGANRLFLFLFPFSLLYFWVRISWGPAAGVSRMYISMSNQCTLKLVAYRCRLVSTRIARAVILSFVSITSNQQDLKFSSTYLSAPSASPLLDMPLQLRLCLPAYRHRPSRL